MPPKGSPDKQWRIMQGMGEWERLFILDDQGRVSSAEAQITKGSQGKITREEYPARGHHVNGGQ